MAHSIQHMQWLTPSSGSLHPAHAMAHSIQHMQWLTPSSTCKAGEQSNGSLHPAQPQPESRAMARSIQHMQWLTPSSTCNGSLHPAHAMAHSIQHMQWLTPSSTCNGSLHPAQPQRAANHLHTSAYICCTLACFSIYMYMYSVRQKNLSIPLEINAISINIYTHLLFDYRHNSIVVVHSTGMV